MGNFATILKELRVSQNMTQDDLAKKLKVAKSSISNYESGIRQPSFDMEEAIADLFNVDLDYLRGRTPFKRLHSVSELEQIQTLAAHHDGIDWTEEELEEVERFKQYVLSKRKNT